MAALDLLLAIAKPAYLLIVQSMAVVLRITVRRIPLFKTHKQPLMIVELREKTNIVHKSYNACNASSQIFDCSISDIHHAMENTTNQLLRYQITSDQRVIHPEAHELVPDRKIEPVVLKIGTSSPIQPLVQNLVRGGTQQKTQLVKRAIVLVVIAVFQAIRQETRQKLYVSQYEGTAKSSQVKSVTMEMLLMEMDAPRSA